MAGDVSVLPLIDCDLDVRLFWDLAVAEHKKMDKFAWDESSVFLHLSPSQEQGGYTKGHDLRQELAGLPVLNAKVLEYLLVHPELIPDSWKGKKVYFWGTIYQVDDKLLVRCLYFQGGLWQCDVRYLDYCWHDDCPAIVLG